MGDFLGGEGGRRRNHPIRYPYLRLIAFAQPSDSEVVEFKRSLDV